MKKHPATNADGLATSEWYEQTYVTLFGARDSKQAVSPPGHFDICTAFDYRIRTYPSNNTGSPQTKDA